MRAQQKITMRDAFIEQIYAKMHTNKEIFFLSGDFGAPMLDKLRRDFSDRFINVGIAEQNLINVATGLALEGHVVYVYFIAPFIMRAYEQVRINLSMTSLVRPINVNMIAVGSGLSYEVSGPTHHCLEDISIMRVLPNVTVFSPSDSQMVKRFADYSINVAKPKYLRFEGKPLPAIYGEEEEIDFEKGFHELAVGEDICIASTGYMTHMALAASQRLQEEGIRIGVLDMFMLKPLLKDRLHEAISKYDHVITLEEAFIGNGGVDSILNGIVLESGAKIARSSFGINDRYVFDIGDRSFLHNRNGMGMESLIDKIRSING